MPDALLVRKAGGTQGNIDAGALDAVSSGMLESIDPAVLQTLQLMLEVRTAERKARVELQWGGIYLGRQSPAPALELPGSEVIEVQDVERGGQSRRPARPPGPKARLSCETSTVPFA